MAITDRTPLINGEAYAYSNISVNILGVVLAGITMIDYAEEAEVVNNYGQGRRPVSRGHGKIEATASISIDRAEYNALVSASPNGSLLDVPEFDIVVSYLPERSAPTVDIIKNCRFKNMKGGAAEGDTNVIAELELVPSHIEWNTNA